MKLYRQRGQGLSRLTLRLNRVDRSRIDALWAIYRKSTGLSLSLSLLISQALECLAGETQQRGCLPESVTPPKDARGGGRHDREQT